MSAARPTARAVRVGVDAGGTFTDSVAERSDGSLAFDKRPSTPAHPAAAVAAALAALSAADLAGDPPGAPVRVVHGSTVATNAFLEGRTAAVGLITNAGLEDVTAIGRQARRRLYDLRPEGPRELVPRERVRGISARTAADGAEVSPLDPLELARAARELAAAGAEVLVVALLHSARWPDAERAAARALADAGWSAVASHAVTPEPREYERWATAIVAAGLTPVVKRWLGGLAEAVPAADLRVMLSNGGTASPREAAERPIGAILSGPAAGVMGARWVARAAGADRLITLDMGGTSCDVAVVPGRVARTTEAELDGIPLRVPLVDIQTVGAGGGSIARVDAAGALVVGPESAGAEPGPACYGRGGERPTVTDAHLVLGHLDPGRFPGGELDPAAATAAIGRLAAALGAGLHETAAAVLALTASRLERAVRRVTLERGHDPADLTLVAFGGAGGLHAVALGAGLGVRRVLVPRAAGVLSALGCLAADARLDFGRAILEPAGDWPAGRLARAFAELEAEGAAALEREGVQPGDRAYVRTLAMRYRGQSYETEVGFDPAGAGAAADFHRTHGERWGHARPGAPVEIVALRLAAVGAARPPALPPHVPAPGGPERRRVGLPGGGGTEVDAWPWDCLPVGHASREPAIVFGAHATALVPPGWSWSVGPHGDLLLEAAP